MHLKRETLPAELMEQFCDYLNDNMGLYYPKKAWEEFEKKIPSISAAFGESDPEKGIRWLLKQPVTKELITTLAEHLTIGETYFFRDMTTIEAIAEKILKPLVAERTASSNRHIKIWCAACCTGEEPYTYAMLLNEMLPEKEKWNISIMGSDINIEFLKRAKKGLYRDWSFRTIPTYYRDKYFTKRGADYLISHEIAKMVRFSYINLIEDQYPSLTNGTGNLDLILCNNVLIYFSKQQIYHVINQLNRCLVQGGYLSVTPVEAPFVTTPALKAKKELGCNIFCNGENRARNSRPIDSGLLKEIKRDISERKSAIQPKSSFFRNFLAEKPPLTEKGNVEKVQSKGQEKSSRAEYVEKWVTLFKRGEYLATIDLLEKLFAESGTIDSDLLPLLIKSHVNCGNIEKAKEWCDKALQIEKTEPTLYYLHAAICQEFNEIDKAVSSLKKAIFLDSDFTIAYFTLGNIMLLLDNSREAYRNFSNVLITLSKREANATIPESDGLTVARLREIVESLLLRL